MNPCLQTSRRRHSVFLFQDFQPLPYVIHVILPTHILIQQGYKPRFSPVRRVQKFAHNLYQRRRQMIPTVLRQLPLHRGHRHLVLFRNFLARISKHQRLGMHLIMRRKNILVTVLFYKPTDPNQPVNSFTQHKNHSPLCENLEPDLKKVYHISNRSTRLNRDDYYKNLCIYARITLPPCSRAQV